MPTARVTQPASRGDGSSYAVGDEVTGEVAQDAVSGGWGELVRQQVLETPEVAQSPERAVHARGRGRPERHGR